MKKKLFTLLFHGIWSVAVLWACKSDEPNPVDKLMGSYWVATYPKNFYLNNPSLITVNLSKKSDDVVNLRANNIHYRRIISQTQGIIDSYKDFEFPNCQMVLIDTTGMGGKNPAFAKIINRDNNIEMGVIRNWIAYPDGIKTYYYRLEPSFFVTDTLKFESYLFKWVD